MKEHVRVLGIDDSEFTFGDDTVPIVGVVTRIPDYIEGMMISKLHVDGRDANKVISRMINRSVYKEQLRLVMLDGGTFGGFNVVDIPALYSKINIPVVTVTRKKPDFIGIQIALKRHFIDWKERLDILQQGDPDHINIGNHILYCKYEGIDRKELVPAIKSTIIKGAMPEPLRLAHLFATALARGESRGRV